MNNDLAQYCEYIPSLSRWRRDPEQDRRDNIAALADDIARIKAMSDIAVDSDDFTDPERTKMQKEVIALRRSILAALSTEELVDLRAKNLRPEDALRIVRDPPKPSPDSEETKALKKQLAAQRSAELASRQYFVATKGFAGTLQSGVSIADMIAAYPDQREFITKLELPCRKQEPQATAADAFHNHVERNQQ
jgi:hypothetical protein